MHKLLLVVLLGLLAVGSTPGRATSQSPEPEDPVCVAAAESSETSGLPDVSLGVADDSVQTVDCNAALANMQQIKDAGYNVVRFSLDLWGPGVWYPRDPENVLRLKVTVGAAKIVGLGVIVNASPDWNPKAKNLHMPLGPNDREQFATWATGYIRQIPGIDAVELGIEPNSCRFWHRWHHECKFGDQSDAAVPYTRLLLATYLPLKMAAEARGRPLKVIGGELSSHGRNDSWSSSPAHFIYRMGRALRSMDCTGPIMDWFSVHPYGVTNTESPIVTHSGGTIGLADIPKLRQVLRKAFRGTCQPDPPIILTEWNVQTFVPSSEASNYSGRETVTTVSFVVQTRFTTLAIKLALKWRVKGLILFLLVDEPKLNRWQSGMFYYSPAATDGSRQLVPKPSQIAISQVLWQAEGRIEQRR